MKRLLFGALFAGLFWAGPVQAQEMTVNISVSVDATKANGSPWDGIPSFGTGRALLPTSENGPDIAVCVVLTTGTPDCYWKTERGKAVAFCENAVKCTIENVSFTRFPVGLIFLDVDLSRHDLIDFVILTGGSAVTDEIAKVEKNMQAAMAHLTPGSAARDRERRMRKAIVFPVDQCVGEKANCDLAQAVFRLEKR
jgi:hypothetical protein